LNYQYRLTNRLSITLPLIFGIALLTLGGCASTKDLATLCSVSNLQLSADKETSRMEREARKALKNLKKSAETWDGSTTPTRRDVVMLNQTIEDFKVQLAGGRGLYNLKKLSSKCQNSNIVIDELSKLFSRQNLPIEQIKAIKSLPVYNFIKTSSPEHWRTIQIQIDVPLPRMENF